MGRHFDKKGEKLKQKIINYIRAGYPGLYLVSAEEQRVEAEITAVVADLKRLDLDRKDDGPEFKLFAWSVTTGLIDLEKKSPRECNDPLEALIAFAELPEKTICVLRDFQMFLDDPNPVLVRQFKDVLQDAKTKNKTLIILGCRLCLPPELERELTVVEFSLPDKAQLGGVLDGILESAKLKPIEGNDRDAALGAASGLTTMEAENAFALSVVQTKRVEATIVAREKAQAVKKNGLLEIIETGETLDAIGGLDLLKDWLVTRKSAYSEKAKQYGLPNPKGLLIVGIPGTGKSLTAKATATVFGVPLLKLDAGRLFGSLVGQSEGNLRSVMQTAEAIAPAVLWIDEIEKGFAGSKSSGATDGGTSARVLGSFLNWMQEKKAPVFIVATANDVSQLPPEMLRKGRFDELFFVDLPSQSEREAIWKIQIAKYGRDAKEFDCLQLARATEGFTGSEIENAFIDALYLAFSDDKEPTDLDIARVLTDYVPLSKLMAEQIDGLRKWAKGRARLATSVPAEERKFRKIAA
jgi:SpoVK/Ycf46/Vps4 family AAA+-type ATPase